MLYYKKSELMLMKQQLQCTHYSHRHFIDASTRTKTKRLHDPKSSERLMCAEFATAAVNQGRGVYTI